VGNDVGSSRPGQGWPGRDRQGLRSLPAKQHAPKARPSPATDRGRRAGVPGRPSRTNGLAVGAARRRGAGHSPLTAGQSRPTAPRAFRRAWWPVRRGETASPRTPLLPSTAQGMALRSVGAAGCRRRCQRTVTAARAGKQPAWRTERNRPLRVPVLLLRFALVAARSGRNARLAGRRRRVANRRPQVVMDGS
jgi:hypothetical protein